MSNEVVPTSRWQSAQWIDHPSGFLAIAPGNEEFSLPSTSGFISYREKGGHLVIFGGVHAPESDRRELLEGFIESATRRKRRVIALQVRASQTKLFTELGFTVNRFGSTYALRLRGFSMAGGKRMKLRQKVQRATRLGVRVLEVGVEIARDDATYTRLSDISTAWLTDKGKKELDFMIGQLGGPSDRERRIFIAVTESGTWSAFITYVPVRGERPGYLHDLTRRRSDAPPGTMELINATAIQRMSSEDAEFLHFGFTPFIFQDKEELPQASRIAGWALAMLGKHGRALYPAVDQIRYKLKWAPEVAETEWIAFRPLSIRGVLDVLLLTRSI